MEKDLNEVKRIIFLDIDGVLAGYDYFIRRKRPNGYIDPTRVALINQLEGAEIVISSSWGPDEGRTEQALRDCGLKLPIIGYTEHFYQDWICRGNEIEKWLRDNAGGMCTKWGDKWREGSTTQKFNYEYVIFDDSEDMLLGQGEHFVKCEESTGVTQKNIDQAKKILAIE